MCTCVYVCARVRALAQVFIPVYTHVYAWLAERPMKDGLISYGNARTMMSGTQ